MPVQLDLRSVRAEARELLRSANVPPLRFTLLFLAVNLVLNLLNTVSDDLFGSAFDFSSLTLSISFFSVLLSLLSLVLLAGYTRYCLFVHRGLEMPYESLLGAFPFAGKVILLSLIEAFLIGFGLALFIIPGVYFAFAYAFALYHLCEEPDIGVIGAMRRSRLETRGFKWPLFLLILSFFPLLFAAALAIGGCGIYLSRALPATLGGDLLYTLIMGVLSGCAEVYLLPYMRLSQVGFYRIVTEPSAKEPAETAENEEDHLE